MIFEIARSRPACINESRSSRVLVTMIQTPPEIAALSSDSDAIAGLRSEIRARIRRNPPRDILASQGAQGYNLRYVKSKSAKDRVDLTQAALKALQPAAIEAVNFINHDEARKLRGKLLGVMIRQRRLQAECSLADCALVLEIEPALIEAWEYGESEPSLPELEVLGQFFNGRQSGAGDGRAADRAARDEYMLLRQRLIGALLRAARESSGRTVEAISESAGLDVGALQRFEFGEETIAVSELTALAQALELDLSYFATPRLMPESSRADESGKAPAETGGDWRQFAAESDNLPFIRLAMAFQGIGRDDLHRIADALVAIIRANGDAKGWSSHST